jgi:hypothetical protein
MSQAVCRSGPKVATGSFDAAPDSGPAPELAFWPDHGFLQEVRDMVRKRFTAERIIRKLL